MNIPQVVYFDVESMFLFGEIMNKAAINILKTSFDGHICNAVWYIVRVEL